MFEDSWPKNGDLDFNDQVVAYNYISTVDGNSMTTDLRCTFNVLAIGSSISNGLYLHLPVPASAIGAATLSLGQGTSPITLTPSSSDSDTVFQLASDTRSLFGGATGFINTDPTLQSTPSASIVLDIQLSTPTAIDISHAPFDIFISRTAEPGHQIHRSQYSGTSGMDKTLFDTGDDNSSAGESFVNGSGLPFALTIPSLSVSGGSITPFWAAEGISITQLYPDLAGFTQSGGTTNTDWYLHPVAADLYAPAVSSTTPEPTSLSMLAIGVMGFAGRGRLMGNKGEKRRI